MEESGRIAIGEVLRRMTASALNELFIQHKESLPCNQLRLLKDGVLLGSYVIALSLQLGRSVVALDMTNAFNSLSRGSLYATTKHTILENYVTWCYGTHSDLILSKDLRIRSQSGVQQGDPLGMTLFCVAVSSPISRVQSRHPEVCIIAYADDIFVIGDEMHIDLCVRDIKHEFELCGLKLNINKSTIWPPLNPSAVSKFELLSTFKHKESVFTVLGVPVAGDKNMFLTDLVDQSGESIKPLYRLKHKQGELVVLRSAGPYTRVNHLLRAIAPDSWPIELLQKIDSFSLAEIENIAGGPLSTNAQSQALSPVSFGRLGLQSATDTVRHRSMYAKGLESIGKQLRELKGLDGIPLPLVPTGDLPRNGAQKSNK